MAELTSDTIQSLAEPKVFERGKNYYEDGSIITPVKRDNRIETFCHGICT